MKKAGQKFLQTFLNEMLFFGNSTLQLVDKNAGENFRRLPISNLFSTIFEIESN